MPGKPRRVYTTRKPIDYLTGPRMPSAGSNMYSPRKGYATGGMVEGYQLGGLVKDDDEDYTVPTLKPKTGSSFSSGGARAELGGVSARESRSIARPRPTLGKTKPGATSITTNPATLPKQGYGDPGPGLARRTTATPSEARTVYDAADRARQAGLVSRQGKLPIGFIPATRDDDLSSVGPSPAYYDPDESPDGAGDFGTSSSGLGSTGSEGRIVYSTPTPLPPTGGDGGFGTGVSGLGSTSSAGGESGGAPQQTFDNSYQRTPGEEPTQGYQRSLYYNLRSSRGHPLHSFYFGGESMAEAGDFYYENWEWDEEVGDYVADAYRKRYGYGEAFGGGTSEGTVSLGDLLSRDLPDVVKRVSDAGYAEKQNMRNDGTYDLLVQTMGQSAADELFDARELTAEERYGAFEEPKNLPERVSEEEKNANAAREAERVQASVGRSLRGLTEKMGARGATVGQMAGVINEAQSMGAMATQDAAYRSELADRAHNLMIDMQIMAAEISYNQMLTGADISEDQATVAFNRSAELQAQQQAHQEEMMRLQALLNTPTFEDRMYELLGMGVGAGATVLSGAAGGWAGAA